MPFKGPTKPSAASTRRGSETTAKTARQHLLDYLKDPLHGNPAGIFRGSIIHSDRMGKFFRRKGKKKAATGQVATLNSGGEAIFAATTIVDQTTGIQI